MLDNFGFFVDVFLLLTLSVWLLITLVLSWVEKPASKVLLVLEIGLFAVAIYYLSTGVFHEYLIP